MYCIPDPQFKHQAEGWHRCKNCHSEFYSRQHCFAEQETVSSPLADLPEFDNGIFVEKAAGKVYEINEQFDGNGVDHVYNLKC